MEVEKKGPMVLFQGKAYSMADIEKIAFPIGCKFHYKNASYNDLFTVTGSRKEPGADFRQIVGSVAGEVWILLSSLQKEAAAGAITFVIPTIDIKAVTVKEPKAKKAKSNKKVKAKSKAKTKGKK